MCTHRIAERAALVVFVIAGLLLPVACSPTPEPASPSPTQDASTPTAESVRPNVVWLMMDTLRAKNLSCYGYHRPTSPTIDALGARGVVFENHYSQGVWTMVSVPSIVTGLYFPTNVIENFDYRVIHRYPRADQRSAPETFGANGYATVMFSAHHMLVSEWTRFGRAFDDAYPVKDPTGRTPHGSFANINDGFLKWLDDHDERPFFAYLHLMDNHFPHAPEGKYAQWLNDDYDRSVFGPGGPKDTDQHFGPADQARMAGLYDGDILFVDDQLKRLQAELDARGLLENTIILITSDHGELLGEDGETWGHENYTEDELIHVPWIMAGPGIPQGVRYKDVTENVDVLPTLIDFADISHNEALDGLSMVPYLEEGGPKLPRKHIFARMPAKRHYDFPTSLIVRDDQFKYVVNLETGEEHLWRVPDLAGQRDDVIESNREAAAELRALLDEAFLPKYEAFRATEIHWILGRVGGGQSENWSPADAVRPIDRGDVPKDIFSDSLWASMPTFVGPNYLVSCGYEEDAPPVTLSYPVPNGRYHVSVELGRLLQFNDRGSSLLMQAEDDTASAPITFDDDTDADWAYRYGGTWNVTDGSFDLRLDEGDRNHWAAMRRVRMHPAPFATYSFPIASLFDQRRGQSPLTLAPDEAFDIAQSDTDSRDEARWTVVGRDTTTLVPPIGPAELTVSIPIPDGEYGLDIEVASDSPSDATMRVTSGNVTVDISSIVPETGMVRGGIWHASQGNLVLTLSSLPDRSAFSIVGFHFYPVTPSGEAADASMLTHMGVHPRDPEDSDAAEQVDREALENLGYVH